MLVPTFCPPDGMDETGITPAEISSLVLHQGADYWEAGSGDAAIRFFNQAVEGEIILMIREPYGVFLQFTTLGGAESWVLCTERRQPESVRIIQCGDPWELPREYFVSREEAAAIASEFTRTGKRPDSQHWRVWQ